jgi:halogenation protein CepH
MKPHKKDDYDVIVVGAGPAGITSATYMAKHGHRSLILEKEDFPRYRLGESLLPSMMPILEDFGLIDAVEACGFPKKTGGTFVWGKDREPWSVLFSENPFLPYPYAYHVDRSKFDALLLNNAKEEGVEVIHGATVVDAIMDGPRVVGVRYTDTTGAHHEVHSKFVVDSSGPRCVLGRKLTKRSYDPKMKQVAFYSYFNDVVGPPGIQAGHVCVESCPKGWFWYIPLDSEELGEASVGLVSGQEFKEEYSKLGPDKFFQEALKEAPYTRQLMGDRARQVQDTRSITDWAYACDRMAGEGFFLAGDAACFLDPLLSSGVSMAMLAGFSSATCMNTALRNPELEAASVDFYDQNYRRMWEVTRDFLHYFYAGNVSAHTDEIFWAARDMLQCGHNVGAKQAFCFMVNTIPSNPHPALRKQIHMFQQFMDHIDHKVDGVADEKSIQEALKEGMVLVTYNDLSDSVIPRINGSLESSWTIDPEEHVLTPVRGVSYDQDRTVFSSTASWLLGRNIYPVEGASLSLIERVDGSASWGQIVEKHAKEHGIDIEESRKTLTPVLGSLCEENLVLLRSYA